MDSSDEQLVSEIGRRAVALFGSSERVPLRFIGSGTWVRVAGSHYILTAAHVWTALKRDFQEVAMTLKKVEDHRFSIEIQAITDTTFGSDQPEEWGPDLAFLRVPDQFVLSIEAYDAIFHNLSIRKETALQSAPETDEGRWVILGVPQETAILTPTHASLEFTGYFMPVKTTHTRDGFDYVDLEVNMMSYPDAPQSFGGVSGGGLWQVLPSQSGSTGEFSWELEGVAFYQSAPKDGLRFVRCHGRRSIYGAMPDDSR